MKFKAKSLLAAALSVLMTVSSVVAYGSGEQNVVADEANVGKYEAAFLDSLGIVSFSEDKLAEPVTNLDFAGAAALVRGMTDDYYCEGMLELLVGAGYMPDVCQYPDRPITYINAVKTFVSVLGYDNEAQLFGGYPEGYLSQASKLKLTKGISGKTESDLVTFGELAIMIYNSLECNSRFAHDEKVLNEIFGIYEGKGRVTQNSITDFMAENKLNEGTIKIDNILYECESDKFDDFFGYNVKFWHKEDSSQVLFMETDDKATKTVDVSGENIGTYDKNRNTLTYYIGARNKSVRLSDGYCLVYNGRVLNMGLEEVLCSGGLLYKERINGNAVISDNNSDGMYDLIKINSYESIFVKRISNYDNTVTAYYDENKYVSFDTDNAESRYRIYDVKGETLLWSNILKDSVITVMMAYDDCMRHGSGDNTYLTYDGPVADIIVSDKKVTSIVDGVETGDEAYIRAAGEKYRVSDNALAKLGNIVTGKNYKLFLDMFDEVAGFLQEDEIFSTGLVTKCFVSDENDEGIEAVTIKVFDENGNEKTFVCADKTTVDGVLYKNAQDIFKAVRDNSDAEKTKIIRYRLNKDERIMCIDTPYYNKNKESEKSLQKISAPGAKYFDKYIRAFYGTGTDVTGIPVDSTSTVMFSYRKDIPDDLDEYKIEEFTTLFNRSYSDVTAYTVDGKNPVTDYVVMALTKDEGTLLTSGYSMLMLDKIVECYVDGEIKYTIKGINLPKKSATEVTVSDISAITAANIKHGDIFVMHILNSGNPGQVSVAYRNETGVDFAADIMSIADPVNATKFNCASNKWVQGKVYFATNGYMYVLPKSKLDMMSTATIADCIAVPMLRYTPGIYLIDGKNGNKEIAKEITYDDIRSIVENGAYADDVLVFARPNDYSAVMVIRNK